MVTMIVWTRTTLKSGFRFRANPTLGVWAWDFSDLPIVGYQLELLRDRSPFGAIIRMRWMSSVDLPQALVSILGYSLDESRLGNDADEDELGAPVNVRRVDVTIRIPRTSLAVRMYNPTNGSKPKQVLPDVDEGAGVGCSGAGPRGNILRSPSSPTTNVSDPKVNWVPRGNFMSKVQGAMVFPDGS
jgi:hypothetical protein